MNNYLVEILLPELQDEKFMSLIPAHRMLINELIEYGIIKNYTINASRTKGWILFSCESKKEVQMHLQKMPIFQFIKFVIHEVMIHDGEHYRLPKLHLN